MAAESGIHRKNWSGNLTYRAGELHLPTSVFEAQEIVRKSGHLRALGTRHCFNDIADSERDQVSLRNLNRVIGLDETTHRVTVEGGIRYDELCPYLHGKGYALHNLASLTALSIAGACATATHGSGDTNGILATAVSALEFVNAEGELVALSRDRDGEVFTGALVGLGAFGVVTRLTLDLQSAYAVRQHVYQHLPLAALVDHFDEITSSGTSVSLFTDWETDAINQVWIKRKGSGGTEAAESEFFGARLATRDLHPIMERPADACTGQMGVLGPWHERLPHVRSDTTLTSGNELQSEYFVPREFAGDAVRRLREIGHRLAPVLLISEIRTIDADDLWMSMCYQRPSVAFHFTWAQNGKGVRKVLPLIEEALDPFDPRPHWGKVFAMPPDKVRARYEKLSDFRDLVRQYDPAGKFRNGFLQRFIFDQ